MSEDTPPKLFEHCSTVFERMKKDARATVIEGNHALVYEGFLTHLFSELNLATPYYTSVMQRLRKMGCVQQLARGGGNAPSRWELIREPDWDRFEVADDRRLQSATKMGQMQGQINSMNTRILVLEDQMSAILRAEGIAS